MAIVHRVLITRHPQTVANTGGFFSGQSNVDLTPLGERQLRHAITGMTAFRPDRVWASPLLRCQAMGHEVARNVGCPLETVDDLAEMCFGVMEGVPFAELPARGITWPWPRDAEFRSVAPEGGETFEQVYERAGRVLERIRNTRGRTVCAAHGAIMRCILGKLLEMPYEAIWRIGITNVASMELTCDDVGKVMLQGLGYSPEEVLLRCATDSIYDTGEAWHERGDV